MKKRILFLFCLTFLVMQFANAQVKQVTGTVTGSEDGLPIPGASVSIKGTTLGTVTNLDGKYQIGVPQSATTLVFSFVGMKTVEVPISGTKIDAVLQTDVVGVDEIMVVAFGTAKKGSFTGSATKIGAEKLASRPVTNLSKALEGATSGVQVNSGSGQPGSGQAIRIRGFGSINASNDPLYVVDGAPYSGNLSNINTEDIESVTILKDAASTALYGNKAANGVIVIKTKQGKAGQGKFEVKLMQGFSERAIPEYDRVNAYDYYPLMWEAYRNQMYYVATGAPTLEVANNRASGLVTGVNGIRNMLGYNIFGVADNEIVGIDGKINPNAKIIPGIEEDLDWYNPIKRTGKRTDLTLSNSGGNDKTSFHSSLGYTNEEGYVLNSGFKRFTGRMNVITEPKKWVKTGLTLSGTMSETDEASTGSSTGYVNPFFFARNMGPLYPVYTHNLKTGEYILDSYGNKIYDLGNMSQYGLPSRPAGASVGRHVVAETLLNVRNVQRNALDGNTFIEIPFLKDFKFTTNLSLNLSNYRNNRFDNKIVGDGSPAGRASKESNLTTTLNFNQLLTYTKNLGNHNFDVLAAHESYDYKYQYFYGFRQGIIADGNIELINFTTTNTLESSVDRYKSEGYFSRINYDFDSKYLLSASYRRDGSSRFAKDVRWGNFWSVGAGWRIDREEFVKGIKAIDMLKLRGSYGEVGVDAGIGYYAWQALYGLGNNNALEPGILQSTLLSDKLTWEKNANFDVALEFGLFERLRGTIEYFNRQSSNLLFDVPKPLSSGILSRDENIGSMYNRGLEVELTFDVVKAKDFSWKIDLNATSFKNQITKMPDGQAEIISGTKKLMVGQSLYDYWLREWTGVDAKDGMVLYRADPTTYKNDLESLKTNPTSTVMTNYRIAGNDTLTFNSNKAKYHYNESAIPKVYGSITNTFNYKQFELSFMLTYQYGGKVYDATYASLMDAGNYGNALHVDMLNRWQKEGDIVDVPRMDGNSTNRGYFGAQSDRWLTDASYINIRSVNFSYNVPKNWMKKIDLSAARLFVSGENLQLFSARKGMAPQQSFTGVTYNDYIPSRILTLGVNVTF